MKQEHSTSSHHQLDVSIDVKQRKSKSDLFHHKLHLNKTGHSVLKIISKGLKIY